MICSECGKKQATIHFVRNINGVTTEKHLCSDCASKYREIQNMDFFSPGDFFKSFLDLGGTWESAYSPPSCERCGFAFKDFQDKGLLGCPDCYTAFRDSIIPVLRSAHGNVQHVGEVPRDIDEEAQKRRQIEELKQQISKAVAEENFEKAAELRDRINQMKGEEK